MDWKHIRLTKLSCKYPFQSLYTSLVVLRRIYVFQENLYVIAPQFSRNSISNFSNISHSLSSRSELYWKVLLFIVTGVLFFIS